MSCGGGVGGALFTVILELNLLEPTVSDSLELFLFDHLLDADGGGGGPPRPTLLDPIGGGGGGALLLSDI